jgi:hypothetical protein
MAPLYDNHISKFIPIKNVEQSTVVFVHCHISSIYKVRGL